MTCYQPGRSKTLSGGVVMGFTFSLKMVGTKILVPGPWYQDLGTKILVPRSWYQDLGTKILVPRSWYQDLGTKILVPRSWYQDPGTKILVPRSWYQDLVPRSWHGQAWHGTEIFGTARILRARHGNPPPPVKGGTGVFLTRHGTSESPESERL